MTNTQLAAEAAVYTQLSAEAAMAERHALGIYDLDLDFPDFDQARFQHPDSPCDLPEFDESIPF